MKKPNAPIKNLLNETYIWEIINTNGSAFTRPWFGQLMTGPELLAYLYQFDIWTVKYKIILDI